MHKSLRDAPMDIGRHKLRRLQIMTLERVGKNYYSIARSARMKRVKKLVVVTLVVMMVAAISVPAMAAYEPYAITLATGSSVGVSSSDMTRTGTGGWAVNVASRANNKYQITYGLLQHGLYTEWDFALVSNTVASAGIGTLYGTYGHNVTGIDVDLGVLINQNDVNMGVRTVGTWTANR